MSSRLSDVAQAALSAIRSAQDHDADDFVSGVTRSFRAGYSRRSPRSRGMITPMSVYSGCFDEFGENHMYLQVYHNDDSLILY